MRLAALVPLLLLAGCVTVSPLQACGTGSPEEVTLYLAERDGQGALLERLPAPGAVPIGDFNEAFLTDTAHPFLSAPLSPGILIHGIVTLEIWIRNQGAPAPLLLGQERDDGYHLFNQFGSDRTLSPAYAVEFDDAAMVPGTVSHYVEHLEMPPGGFQVEQDYRVRVLLTSLVVAGDQGMAQEVLVGGDHPSQVTFTALCMPTRSYETLDETVADVTIPGHQGLLTGAIPPTEGLNMHTTWFDLAANTTRLSIELRQTGDVNPIKDDMDLVLVSANGSVVYSAGSPHADETMVLWEPNLRAFLPPGQYGARVHSYSGLAYQGTLTLIQEA